MSYHISREGQKLGTFSEEEVIEGLEKGEILATDELWTEGMDEWQPVSEVIEVDEDEDVADAPAAAAEPDPVEVPAEPEDEILPVEPEAPVQELTELAPEPEVPEDEPLHAEDELVEPEAPVQALAEPASRVPPVSQAPPAVVYVPVGPSVERGQYGVAGSAIASTVLGILSLICLFLTGLPAIAAGHMARRQIRRSGGAYSGDGLAVAGLIMGYVISTLSISWLMLLLFGAPVPLSQSFQDYKAERHVRSEGRELALALKQYASTHATRFPASMEQFVQEKGMDTQRLKQLQRTELGSQWKGEPGWRYLGDGVQDSDANDRPLLISKMADAEGHHLVVYHDSSTEKAEVLAK